ncbi:MAG: tetratricopeptide repeat protein [Fimbriimonadales bacterium]
MVCTICKSDNTPDAKFCCECGAKLEAAASKIVAKPEEIDQLLKDGYKTFHEKNVDEALYIADAVLGTDPENSSALALKGMCHESKEEFEKAIEVFEQVVILNPDSTLDRIKLSQLRHRVADASSDDEEMERKSKRTVAIFTGVAAALIIMTTGVLVAVYSKSAQASQNKGDLYAQNQAVGFDLTQPAPNTNSNGNTNNGGAEGANSGQLPNAAPDTNAGSNFSPPRILNSGSAGNGGSPPNYVVTPVSSQLPDPNKSSGNTITDAGNNGNGGTSPTNPPDTGPRDEKPKGRIEIKPSAGSGDDNGMESENTYRVAQQKMQAGDYQGAVRDFEASLKNSNQPGLTHQLIARCHKKLGNGGAAKTHLQSALTIYENSGNKAGADACKRELQSLGG